MLPNSSDYTLAFQNPNYILSDSDLVVCTCPRDQFGNAKVQSGGFALTFRLESPMKTWAVRCFHREVKNRDRRYAAISSKLNEAALRESGYFVDFEYQPTGITIKGSKYPIVKMSWAVGETLDTFLETNHRNSQYLRNLQGSLQNLYKFLAEHHIAHGDIHPGNIMVSDCGRLVQLIDYDGMFVPSIEKLGAAETGVPNFQHPERSKRGPWNDKLDRFPFIMLEIALAVLELAPDYWTKTNSSEEKILFDATDYNNPYASRIFKELKADSRFSRQISAFQRICEAGFDDIPEVSNYLEFKFISAQKKRGGTVHISYQGNHEVLEGTDVRAIEDRLGQVVEIIGKVIEVKEQTTRYRKPYIFVNFTPWKRGTASFRLVLWSEVISLYSDKGISSVSSHLSGKYISVVGMINFFENNNGSSYQIIPDKTTQIQVIDEDEAEFRLGRRTRECEQHFGGTSVASAPGPTEKTTITSNGRSNQELYEDIAKKSGASSRGRSQQVKSSKYWITPKPSLTTPTPNAQSIGHPQYKGARSNPITKQHQTSSNAEKLEGMRKKAYQQATVAHGDSCSAQSTNATRSSYSSNSSGCLGVVIVAIGITILSIAFGGSI